MIKVRIHHHCLYTRGKEVAKTTKNETQSHEHTTAILTFLPSFQSHIDETNSWEIVGAIISQTEQREQDEEENDKEHWS